MSRYIAFCVMFVFMVVALYGWHHDDTSLRVIGILVSCLGAARLAIYDD